MDEDTSRIRQEIEETRNRVGDTVEALAFKTNVPARVKDALDERVSNAKDAVGRAVGIVSDRASQANTKINQQVGTMSGSLSGQLETVRGRTSEMRDSMKRGGQVVIENPLGIVVGALAVGFIGGLFIPISNFERNSVGPVRDKLMNRAQGVAQDVLDQGQEVVRETAQVAATSAVSHAQRLVHNGDESGADKTAPQDLDVSMNGNSSHATNNSNNTGRGVGS